MSDAALTLPPNDDRQLHPRRMVVVLSGPDTNSDPTWRFVSVAPLSSESSRKTRFCVRIPAGEANVTKKVWVRVPAVQPLMKSHLEDKVGVLGADRLAEIQARFWQYLGMIDDSAGEDDAF
ncbi:type II toxin-antitoxin system PemK/MazF family toxin [Dactylosporangium sp. CA-052675]|uniref:type II toxin-antitoxin system PemK/MazF family toxin n=1 Tax=Dactylosporangium sp. CA-052675 TaxID=3239927 RepID=UPI003D934590